MHPAKGMRDPREEAGTVFYEQKSAQQGRQGNSMFEANCSSANFWSKLQHALTGTGSPVSMRLASQNPFLGHVVAYWAYVRSYFQGFLGHPVQNPLSLAFVFLCKLRKISLRVVYI